MKIKTLAKYSLPMLALASSSVLAQTGNGTTLTDTVKSGIGLFGALQVLAVAVAFFFGVFLFVKGAITLAKHGEDKREATPVKILVNIVAGIILIGLTLSTEILQNTLFGDSDDNGAKLDNMSDEAQNFQ